MQNAKNTFLANQFFLSAWAASVRRNKTWENLEGNDRSEFRQKMKAKVEQILLSYTHPIDSETHIKNIEDLHKFSKDNGVEFNIGKCQKLLNLLCKYYWCAGWICEPPHNTLDKQIICKVANKENDLKNQNWTKIDDIETYKKIIDEVTAYAKNEGYDSAVVWELCNWKDSLAE